MNQLVFKFPFKTKYDEHDFYVSTNNFSAYKLIENWPSWPGKWLNIFGDSGSGKTHLSKILEKKIKKIKIIDANNINNEIIDSLINLECLIIDNFNNNIEENLFYSILNSSKQIDNFIVINSKTPVKETKFSLKDLQSRINSFVYIGIELPTDDLLRVIISKSFSANVLGSVGDPLMMYISPELSDCFCREKLAITRSVMPSPERSEIA